MDTSKKYKLLRNLIIISFFVEIVLFFVDSVGLFYLMDKVYFPYLYFIVAPTPSLLLAIFAVVCTKYFFNAKKSVTEPKKPALLFVFSLLMVFFHVAGHFATICVSIVAYGSRF